jgi:hypothetical protein
MSTTTFITIVAQNVRALAHPYQHWGLYVAFTNLSSTVDSPFEQGILRFGYQT